MLNKREREIERMTERDRQTERQWGRGRETHVQIDRQTYGKKYR
jgi:hypothetical protein